MFNFIRGVVAEMSAEYIVIDNGGVGWQIYVPSTVLHRLASVTGEVKLYTYLSVREDAMQLYGFMQQDELALFRLLLTVSGIGPKAALGILSNLSAGEFYLAVLHENVKALTRVPGIGEKSAKRIIVELKEKAGVLSKNVIPIPAPATHSDSNAYSDALEALLALGYSGTEAQSALQAAAGSKNHTAQDLIKDALAYLGLR